MDIEDAFTQEAIAAADTNVEGADEEYLRDLIGRIYTTNDLPAPSHDALNVAMLCFVAGRTYQSDLEQIAEETSGLMTVALSPKAVSAFINLLLEQRAEGEA